MPLILETPDKVAAEAITSFEDLFLYKLFLEPIFYNKIVVLLVDGKSGVGKSMFSLAIAEKLEKLYSRIKKKNQEVDPISQVIYTPSEYGDKINNWIKSSKVTIVVDELRFLVPKQKWQSLLNQSIAEVNVTFRDTKIQHCGHGGVIIYNTQDITDITKDVRKTIDIEIEMFRNRKDARAFVYQYWLDKRNLEKPILRRKKATFHFGGTEFRVDVVRPVMPSTKIKRIFQQTSRKAKLKILERKRDIILREINKDLGLQAANIKVFLKNDEMFEMLKGMARWRGESVTFSAENKTLIRKMLNLSHREFKDKFIPAFLEEAKQRGLI